MIRDQFKVSAGKETLAVIELKASNDLPRFVYLHGGGLTTSSKERVYDIAKPVLEQGINILAFDHSGHGQSSGQLKQSSLKKRVQEATAVLDLHAAKAPLIMCGASMGGYIAIKMLELYPVETLVLMCPALYDARAYDVGFNNGFTEIIRAPESWRNTDLLPLLESFTGKLLVIMGDKDEVIPAAVIEMIMNAASRTSKKELYTIQNCPHKINDWLVDYPQELEQLCYKIGEFLG